MKLTKKEILKRLKEKNEIHIQKKEIDWLPCTVWYIWKKEKTPDHASAYIVSDNKLDDEQEEVITDDPNFEWLYYSEKKLLETLEKDVLKENDLSWPKFKIWQLVCKSDEYGTTYGRIWRIVRSETFKEYQYYREGKDWYLYEDSLEVVKDPSLYLHTKWN